MPNFEDQAKYRTQQCADASGDPFIRHALGTPGSLVQTEIGTFETGAVWAPPSFVECLVRGLANGFNDIGRVRIRNASSTQLEVGEVVRLVGPGDYDADRASSGLSSAILGVVEKPIGVGNYGYVRAGGPVDILLDGGVPSVGDLIYLSGTTAGRFSLVGTTPVGRILSTSLTAEGCYPAIVRFVDPSFI